MTTLSLLQPCVRLLVCLFMGLLSGLPVLLQAQVAFSGNYSQDFNTLDNRNQCFSNQTWQDNQTLQGWYVEAPRYRVCDGAMAAGAAYNFGAHSDTDRALGSIASSGDDIHFGVRMRNRGSTTHRAVIVTYRVEQWRRGNLDRNRLSASYQLTTQFQGLTAGTWSALPGLEAEAPVTQGVDLPLDGNRHWIAVQDTIYGIHFQPGTELILRWTDLDERGGDDGLAVDDLQIQACSADPEPARQALDVRAVPTGFNSADVSWTRGDGTRCIVVAHLQPQPPTLADQLNYQASANYGSGTSVGPDAFVVYAGTGTQVSVNQLQPSTNYFFTVYEVNGTGCQTRVLNTDLQTIGAATDPAPLPVSGDTLKVMYYNALKFPGPDATQRIPYLRQILQYTQPDLLVMNELYNEAGADSILHRALNVGPTTVYRRTRFTGGPDTDNILFYNSDKLSCVADTFISTLQVGGTRDIDHYLMQYRNPCGNDSVLIDVYALHLKAGEPDTVNNIRPDIQRLLEVQELNRFIQSHPTNTNAIVAGDFNTYTSQEPAYQALLTNRFQMKDPVNAPGAWTENPNFSCHHTQSTRAWGDTMPAPGPGVTGGLDDRFDHIMVSNNVMLGQHRVTYVQNSYLALGNDCNLFNRSVRHSTSVPDSIAEALYHFSDHLPVLLDVAVETYPCGPVTQQQAQLEVRYNSQPIPNGANLPVGSATVGCGETYDIVIANTGNAPLDLTDVQLNDPTGSFQLNSPAMTTLAPGEQITASLVFQPTVTGSIPATLTLLSSDPANSPYTLQLVGTGTPAQQTPACANDLIISQLVESRTGNGYEKYLELHNGSDRPIDLSNYGLRISYNAGSLVRTETGLTGTLQPGQTYVISHPNAVTQPRDATSPVINFNGNDAFILYRLADNQPIDIFGVENDNPDTTSPPDTGWTTASGVRTANVNLIRTANTHQGVTVNPTGSGSRAFTTLATEWRMGDLVTFEDLGSHTMQCGPAPVTLTASNNAPVCANPASALQLTATISPSAPATFTWRGPNGFRSNQQNPVIQNPTTAASGTYTVTAVVNNCQTYTAETTALVSWLPDSLVIRSNAPVCIGENLWLETDSIPGLQDADYAWAGPEATGFSGTRVDLPFVQPNNLGCYSLQVSVPGCPPLTEQTCVDAAPGFDLEVVEVMDAGCTLGRFVVQARPRGQYEYSLDGQTYNHTTGEFRNMRAGRYTVYARKGNCTAQIDVTVGQSLNAPQNVRASATTNTLTVGWQPVPGAMFYNVRYRRLQSNDPWQFIPNLNVTTHDIPNLISNTTYEVQVQAVCGNNTATPFSSSVEVSTTGVDCQAPQLEIRPLPPSQYEITWPAQPGAVCYELNYGPIVVQQSSWNKELIQGSQTRIVVPAIPTLAYGFQMRTNCSFCSSKAGDRSEWSDLVEMSPLVQERQGTETPRPSVEVYPNPTAGKLTVVGPAAPQQPAVLRLFDLTGQLVQTHQAVDTRTELDLSALPAGVYFLRWESDGFRTQKRIVLQ